MSGPEVKCPVTSLPCSCLVLVLFLSFPCLPVYAFCSSLCILFWLCLLCLSLLPCFTRGARCSIGKWGSCFFLSRSAGNKVSVSATGNNDTSSGEISSYSKVFDTLRSASTVTKNRPRPCSSSQRRPPVNIHAPFLENSTPQPVAVKSLTAMIGR